MDSVRMGVIGLGGMGHAHCKSVVELGETVLTCVCDNDKQVTEERAAEFGVRGFSDYREMIDSGLCDAVMVAVPHWFHLEISIYAFEKGVHVLSEKPIAVTVSDADRMIESARLNKRIFSATLQKRLNPPVRKAFEIVKQGLLGEVKRTLCVDSWYRTQAYYNSGTWRATWKGEGAGVLINQAPHVIDIFMVLGGMPEKVEALTRTRFHDIEVEDEVHAMLTYKNGACGYYYTSTFEPVEGPFMEICGDRGKLVFDRGKISLYRYESSMTEFSRKATDMWESLKVEKVDLKVDEDVRTGHVEVIRNFAAAVLGREELLIPGEEGLYSVEFGNACTLSGFKKKPVKLPLDRQEFDDLMEHLKKISKPKKNVRVQRATDPKFKK